MSGLYAPVSMYPRRKLLLPGLLLDIQPLDMNISYRRLKELMRGIPEIQAQPYSGGKAVRKKANHRYNPLRGERPIKATTSNNIDDTHDQGEAASSSENTTMGETRKMDGVNGGGEQVVKTSQRQTRLLNDENIKPQPTSGPAEHLSSASLISSSKASPTFALLLPILSNSSNILDHHAGCQPSGHSDVPATGSLNLPCNPPLQLYHLMADPPPPSYSPPPLPPGPPPSRSFIPSQLLYPISLPSKSTYRPSALDAFVKRETIVPIITAPRTTAPPPFLESSNLPPSGNSSIGR